MFYIDLKAKVCANLGTYQRILSFYTTPLVLAIVQVMFLQFKDFGIYKLEVEGKSDFNIISGNNSTDIISMLYIFKSNLLM